MGPQPTTLCDMISVVLTLCGHNRPVPSPSPGEASVLGSPTPSRSSQRRGLSLRACSVPQKKVNPKPGLGKRQHLSSHPLGRELSPLPQVKPGRPSRTPGTPWSGTRAPRAPGLLSTAARARPAGTPHFRHMDAARGLSALGRLLPGGQTRLLYTCPSARGCPSGLPSPETPFCTWRGPSGLVLPKHGPVGTQGEGGLCFPGPKYFRCISSLSSAPPTEACTCG